MRLSHLVDMSSQSPKDDWSSPFTADTTAGHTLFEEPRQELPVGILNLLGNSFEQVR